MQNKEPDEVNGLQGIVSYLKSVRNRIKLTIKDDPQNENEWTLDDCIRRSQSFRLFCREVHPDYFDRLLPLCLDLDFYLDKSSIDDYLVFNIEKHGKGIIYNKLDVIRCKCFDNYTDSKWFYNYISQITNLAYNGDSVRKAIERSR